MEVMVFKQSVFHLEKSEEVLPSGHYRDSISASGFRRLLSYFISSEVQRKECSLGLKRHGFLIKMLTHTCTFLHPVYDSIELEAASLTELKYKTPARQPVLKPYLPTKKLILQGVIYLVIHKTGLHFMCFFFFFLIPPPMFFLHSSNQPGPQQFKHIITKKVFCEFMILKLSFLYLMQLFILDAAMFRLSIAM